jgi:catalase
VPVEIIGEMELNRVVDEYFPEVEQVAFCTSHVVPGIGFSDDPLLQGRNFSYQDTQLSRLGINWEELPINRPICPVLGVNRDGQGRHRITKGTVNYWPNRFQQLAPTKPSDGGYHEFPQRTEGIKQRIRGEKFKEHYNQAQLFYNSLAPFEKEHIKKAISFEISHVDDPLVYERYADILAHIDLALAQEVAQNVGGVVPEKALKENKGQSSAHLSNLAFQPKVPTIKARRVAILVADGFALGEVQAIKQLLLASKAVPYVIGPRRGKIYAAGEKFGVGQHIWADHHFEGQRSTLFDGLIIPSGEDHAAKLAKNGRAIHWVREAFGHLKPIGAIGDGVDFLKAVALPGVGLTPSLADDKVTVSYGVVTAGQYDVASAAKDALTIAEGPTGFLSNFAYVLSKHRCWERETDGLADQVAY